MRATPDPKKMYQDSAARGATPIELVVILYNSAIENMRRALLAMQQGDVPQRTAEIGHALLVLQQLQGTLDFDRGGQSAQQFEQFYNLVRAKLLEAQMRNSPEVMQQQIRFMSEVRDCWIQAERQLQLRPNPSALQAAAAIPEQEGSGSQWNA